MKKLVTGFVAFGILTAACTSSVFAATGPSIDIQSSKKTITYKYDFADEKNGYEYIVSKVFNFFKDSSANKEASDTITIKSTAAVNEPVELSLRIETKESYKDDYAKSGVRPADYYDLVVTAVGGAVDGDVIYDDTMSGGTDKDGTKEIPLGTFNKSFTEETKKYKVSATVNSAAASVLKKSDANNYEVYLVSKKGSIDATPIPTYGTKSSAAPSSTASATQSVVKIVPTPTVAPSPTRVPSKSSSSGQVSNGSSNGTTSTVIITTPPTNPPTAKPTPVTRVKKCDEDLKAGTYKVTGRGKVTITDSNGNIISENNVRPSSDAGSIDGVEEFRVTLKKGDTVTATAFDGDSKPDIKFEYITTATTAPKKAATTTTTKTTAKATTRPTSTPKTTATAKPSKTNPKTGDSSLAIGAVVSIMLLAGVSVGGMEVYKRKKKN